MDYNDYIYRNKIRRLKNIILQSFKTYDRIVEKLKAIKYKKDLFYY